MEIYWSETKHTTPASTITNLLHFSTFSPLLAIFFAFFLCSLSLLQQAPTLPHSCSTLFLSSSVWWCASPPFNEQLGRSILFILQSSLCSRVLINHLLCACASVNHHILIPPPKFSPAALCVCVCQCCLLTQLCPFFSPPFWQMATK